MRFREREFGFQLKRESREREGTQETRIDPNLPTIGIGIVAAQLRSQLRSTAPRFPDPKTANEMSATTMSNYSPKEKALLVAGATLTSLALGYYLFRDEEPVKGEGKNGKTGEQGTKEQQVNAAEREKQAFINSIYTATDEEEEEFGDEKESPFLASAAEVGGLKLSDIEEEEPEKLEKETGEFPGTTAEAAAAAAAPAPAKTDTTATTTFKKVLSFFGVKGKPPLKEDPEALKTVLRDMNKEALPFFGQVADSFRAVFRHRIDPKEADEWLYSYLPLRRGKSMCQFKLVGFSSFFEFCFEGSS